MKEKKRAVMLSCMLGLVLLAAIVGYIALQRTAGSGSSYYVRIMQDGKCIETIDLSQVEEPCELQVKTEAGGYNTVSIHSDSVGIVDASCPDKLCQKQGFIKNSSEAIVCLPNRLVIELEKKEASAEEFDVVIQ